MTTTLLALAGPPPWNLAIHTETCRKVLKRAAKPANIVMNPPVASSAGKSGQPLGEGCSRASLFAFSAPRPACARQ